MSVRTLPALPMAPSGSFRTLAAEGWARVVLMIRARRTRQMLADMDGRMLADIGISRGDALMESGRSMWDITPPRR